MARNEVDSSTLPKDSPIQFDPKSGFVGGGVIDVGAAKMNKDEIDSTAFMHEDVTIRLHRQTGKGAYEIVPVAVGEDMRWVKVGVPVTVKRKHVEALLHARTTEFDQAPMESAYADVPELKASTTYSFPFEVIKDTPEGHSWRAKIMERQA
jgi:hypothetical protein